MYSNQRSTRRIDWKADTKDLDGIELQQPETLMLTHEQKKILETLIEGLVEQCQKVMQFYRLSYSMKEIAKAIGVKDANSARQRVFQCRKRLVALA